MKYAQITRTFCLVFCLCHCMLYAENSSKNNSAAEPALKITHLTGDAYIYTTYNYVDSVRFPSNSLYLVTDSGVVMFDTPWDSTQFQPLLDSIWQRHRKKVVLCISTHHHADRTAGVEFLRKNGVRTYSSYQTYKMCAEHKDKQPEFFFLKDTTFRTGQYTYSTFYPGEGHSPDNIVIWIGSERILYGGCFVKSTESQGLGYTGEANVKEWPASVKRTMKKFPDPAYVIPGHFDWTDKKSLKHTLRLLKKHS